MPFWYRCYCRAYQAITRLASRLLPWREPLMLVGPGSVRNVAKRLKILQIESVLIVTDRGIEALGLMTDFLHDLQKEQIHYRVYADTQTNPTINNIEAAFRLYQSEQCQAIIGFGGGSSIDCAKGVGVRVANPKKTIDQMKGVLKVRKQLPTLIAIPTTAGTGSEATIAAVISDPIAHEKYAIMDTVLMPHYAVLDPLLTLKLPPHLTATTGIDALTHAIEAYIGKSNTADTKKWSVEAIKLIFDELPIVYKDGSNVQARSNMQQAAFIAGKSFTRAYVGYVHAIAHTLGGFYGVPHGLANAIVLPYVLDYYGSTITVPLAELAYAIGVSRSEDTIETSAQNFIIAVNNFLAELNIQRTCPEIVESDIPLMIDRALQEAHPLYPVPTILGKRDLEIIYEQIRG